MNRPLKKTGKQLIVLGKLIEQVRREHKLTIATLAMLSGLTDAQIKGIEEDNTTAFIDDAHRIDCARRIAIAMGLPEHHFLDNHASASAQRVLTHKTRSSVPQQLARGAWESLPVADLKVLAKLRTIDHPSAPEQRRHGSPFLIALLVSLLLATLMLGLTFVR
jgi:transcriptional regulator with XRE-family HTH domain